MRAGGALLPRRLEKDEAQIQTPRLEAPAKVVPKWPALQGSAFGSSARPPLAHLTCLSSSYSSDQPERRGREREGGRRERVSPFLLLTLCLPKTDSQLRRFGHDAV